MDRPEGTHMRCDATPCQVSKALLHGSKGKMARDAAYHAGLMLKVNLKLGGENVYARPPEPERPPLHKASACPNMAGTRAARARAASR